MWICKYCGCLTSCNSKSPQIICHLLLPTIEEGGVISPSCEDGCFSHKTSDIDRIPPPPPPTSGNPPGKNRECPFFRLLGYCPCTLREIMKIDTIKSYNRKTGIFLNNQQLKYPTQVKNREPLNLVFLFFSCIKTDIPCFPFGASVILCISIWKGE